MKKLLTLIAFTLLVPSTFYAMKPKKTEETTCLKVDKENVCMIQKTKPSHGTTLETIKRHPKPNLSTQALFDAIENGSLQDAKKAIDKGADINTYNEHGYTPFAWIIKMQGKNSRNALLLADLLLSKKEFNPLKRTQADDIKDIPVAFILIKTGTPLALELLKRFIKHPNFDFFEKYQGMTLKEFAAKFKENDFAGNFLKLITTAQKDFEKNQILIKKEMAHKRLTEEYDLYGEDIAS